MATVENSTNNTIISGTASADSIWNKGDNVTVNANGGNDTIRNGFEYSSTYDNSYVVINAGDGKDEIWNTDSYVTINGGAGDDSLDFSGGHIMAYGGEGNDTVTFWCAEENDSLLTGNYLDGGEGNNTIRAFSGGHKFTVNAGSGNDEIDVTATNSTINAGEGNNHVTISERWFHGSFTSRTEKMLVNTGSGHDVVETWGADKSTINSGGGSDNVWNTGQNNIINLGAGNDFAQNNYIEQDGRVISNGEGVIINGEAGNDILVSWASSDTLNGGSGKDTIYGNSYKSFVDGGTDNDVIVIGHWVPEFAFHDTYIDAENPHNIATITSDTSEQAVEVSNITIKGGKGNDSIAICNKATKNVLQYASSDGNDVVYGYNSTTTLSITGDGYSTQNSGNDVIVKVGTGSITLKSAKGTKLNIKGTKSTNALTSTTLTVTNSTKSPVTVGSAIKTINASTRTKAIVIYGNTLANTIIGGSGADSLSGSSGNDTLNGGKGNDTLNGGNGNDTLTGGAGNDVFVYTNGQGNDVITDYTSNQDKIRIKGGNKISKTSVSGSDVILTVGTGSIRLKNGKGKTLSIYNNENTLTSTVIGGSTTSTTLTVTNSTKSPVTVGSAIKIIDASKRTTAVRINGNAIANTIKGGSSIDTIYGGAGNDSILGNNGNDKLFGDAGNDKLLGGNGADTLTGGKGNDTLTGGAGADVFVYATGDGNDVITDYTAQDKLRIIGSYSTLTSGNDVVVKIGTGQMTLKNAKDVKLNITKVSSYEERWFTEDDNNFTASDVSSILKSDNLISNDYKLDSELQLNQNTDITSLTYNQTKK